MNTNLYTNANFCVYIIYYIYAFFFFFKISVFSKTPSLRTSLVQGPPAGITLHGGRGARRHSCLHLSTRYRAQIILSRGSIFPPSRAVSCLRLLRAQSQWRRKRKCL